MYWEIHPSRTKRFLADGDFVPSGHVIPNTSFLSTVFRFNPSLPLTVCGYNPSIHRLVQSQHGHALAARKAPARFSHHCNFGIKPSLSNLMLFICSMPKAMDISGRENSELRLKLLVLAMSI